MRVTLIYPNSMTREVLLAGVPRAGEHIRLKNGADEPAFEVLQVTWMEGNEDPPEPIVIVSVRRRTESRT